ncbi:hypothetical protein GOP47_0018885 [Adiantum capillus-veneris]|uniref:Uncharacterized protein n=1 Tax=Adiantum capillus-veneris TaxID=13818 RepID=A0A9D4UE31_ADICA|nr:hypothetical protein GOP47_0018885 [Adiantum capillus-veneris]
MLFYSLSLVCTPASYPMYASVLRSTSLQQLLHKNQPIAAKEFMDVDAFVDCWNAFNKGKTSTILSGLCCRKASIDRGDTE